MTILAKYQLLMLQGYALFFFYQVFNQYHMLASVSSLKCAVASMGSNQQGKEDITNT